ncbi:MULTISPECIES: 5-carboxymethyl-2-hydroxymuconate Delta-isomerase [unclassified Acinetobacter]|uniref:5-carboxymethyl-2-hydroxymuconate Delta-isomerase n=1 Tax=unclassified Acinetobacter TaxID=196816 RepID=UPI002934321A|nr:MULTISPECIES: 5-carboxymethyl-2-hydroxymuconate Delta-isomerase [unclassified Acinetobacter]WOE31342.1 5-carboxymethyl-2-hydroxymuconate Delta-isomerase [Acinetobacter sp. SAAs470]WOE39538.1 5-carboxymethyl-2-hydroxymuconate Delta-isomerase [Acinetobacter sp. SAAs474]
MPHIHVEYSDNIENLATQSLLLALNHCLVEGQYAVAVDIKSRAIAQTDYCIGLAEKQQAYVHVKVSLLTGRSLEIRQEISQKVLQVLSDQLAVLSSPLTIQACVEIFEMPVETYAKKII